MKLAQPFPAPELRTRIYGHEDFSEQRSLVLYSFRVELQNGLRELPAFAEH